MSTSSCWKRRSGTWNNCSRVLPPPWLATRVVLAGEEMTVADLLAHLLEHDQYHAGQVNLLRLRYGPPPEQEG